MSLLYNNMPSAYRDDLDLEVRLVLVTYVDQK